MNKVVLAHLPPTSLRTDDIVIILIHMLPSATCLLVSSSYVFAKGRKRGKYNSRAAVCLSIINTSFI